MPRPVPPALLAPGLAAGLLPGLLLGACGTPSVDHEDLAARTSAVLEQKVGQKPDRVTCPDDLPGRKGATTRCTLTDAGTSYPVSVVVTGVRDSDVRFSVKVGRPRR